MSASLRDTCRGGSGHAARCRECRWVVRKPLGMQPLGASTLLLISLGGGCWRCAQAAATRGDVSREWRFSRDPPFSLVLCVLLSLACPAKYSSAKKAERKAELLHST